MNLIEIDKIDEAPRFIDKCYRRVAQEMINCQVIPNTSYRNSLCTSRGARPCAPITQTSYLLLMTYAQELTRFGIRVLSRNYLQEANIENHFNEFPWDRYEREAKHYYESTGFTVIRLEHFASRSPVGRVTLR